MVRYGALFLLTLASPAFGQAGPVPSRGVNYGPGRIDADAAIQYVGQNVTACGRAAQTYFDGRNVSIGVSPRNTLIVLPPDVEAGRYTGEIICVNGLVRQEAGRVAIDVTDAGAQIEVYRGVAPRW